MTLTRPLCVIDTETTGTDTVADRIIEFAAVVYHSDNSRKLWCQRFNPGIPIPEEATAVHGIKDDDVAGCPRFAALAPKIHRALQEKDIAGYNVRFDLAILDTEFRLCGLKLNLTGGAMDLTALEEFCLDGKRPADLAGRLYFDERGELRYGFGKVKDLRVRDDIGFAQWCLRQQSPAFHGSTCDLLRAEMERG